MDETQFIFQVGSVDQEVIAPQVSAALERRLEIRNQQMMPKRNAVDPKTMTKEQQEAMRKRERMKKIIWGVVLAALGLYLFVPSLKQPKEMILQLIVGALAIVMGLNNLLRGGKQKDKPKDKAKFDNAAKEFLEAQAESIKDKKLQVAFFDEEIVMISGELEELDQETVAYSDVEVALETKDVFLLTHNGRGVLLQKKDIIFGELNEFREFLAEKTRAFEMLNEEEEQQAIEEEKTED